MKKTLEGTDLIVVQALIVSLNQAAERVEKIRVAIDSTVVQMGEKLLGKMDTSKGRYFLTQEADGSFVIAWQEKPVEPSPNEPQGSEADK